MQTAVRNNLILTEFSSLELLADLRKTGRQREFYQQFISGLFKGVPGKKFFCELADKMACVAHDAYILRRMDIIEQASCILLNLPIPREYKNVGKYYQALCMKKQGKAAEACALLEHIRVIQFSGKERKRNIVSPRS